MSCAQSSHMVHALIGFGFGVLISILVHQLITWSE